MEHGRRRRPTIDMTYRLKIGESIVELDVSPPAGGQALSVRLGEGSYQVLYRALPESRLHMTINGRGTEAVVIPGEQGKHIFVKGRTFFVQDADRLPMRHGKKKGPEESPAEVTPPMPSVVVRVLVEEGDPVKRGDSLVVVSAMKMETTLVAPSNGRVKKINTSVGAKVAPGDILVEIEEGGSTDA